MSNKAELKDLIRAATKTIPTEDVDTGELVFKEEVHEELDEIRKKTNLLNRLNKYSSAKDLISDFSLDAAKRVVMEMENGKMGGDRLRAAESILNRSLGKPIERIANIGMEVSEKTDVELDSKIKELMELFSMPSPNAFKATDKNAAIYMDTPKSDSVDSILK